MRFATIPSLTAAALLAVVSIGVLLPSALAQDEAIEFQINDELRRDIIKSLSDTGMSPAEIAEFMAGIDGIGPMEDGPALADSLDAAPATRTFADGSPLYLPIGNRLEIDFDQAPLVELPFYADGPGMLTLACFNGESPANAGIEVLLASGEQLINSRSRNPGLGEGIRLVPIGGAGEYLVRLRGLSGPTTILAEWLPYPTLEGSETMTIPGPRSQEMIHLQANTQAVFSTAGIGGAWLQFEAQADGQINIELEGRGGDLMLTVYGDNNFEDPEMYLDNDLTGDVAHEVASFPVQAGRTYHVHVDANRDNAVQVRSRTVFIPLPPDAE